MPFPVRSFIGPRTKTGLYARGPIFSVGLCHFRYGHSLGPVPKLGSMHVVPFPVRGSASTGRDSFCTISGTLQCHFRYGHSLGPVPKLGSIRVVPFPVRDSASSGTVIHWVPYRNWALYGLSHFRYGTLPVPVRSLTGSRTETGLYARWVRPSVGLWVCGFVGCG